MLINTSQQIKLWELYFPEVADTNKLGILVNMFNIGSIVSFFFTPYVADRWGRKFAITCGCLIMCLGGCLSAFCNGYGSK
jgi:MFS family permease